MASNLTLVVLLYNTFEAEILRVKANRLCFKLFIQNNFFWCLNTDFQVMSEADRSQAHEDM